MFMQEEISFSFSKNYAIILPIEFLCYGGTYETEKNITGTYHQG